MDTVSHDYLRRCQDEVTRSVIFLLRYKANVKSACWHVDSVWLDREEAELYRKAHEYRWTVSHVFGVPADGQLAELLRRQHEVLGAVKADVAFEVVAGEAHA